MRVILIILLAACLVEQSAFAQEFTRTKRVIDTIPVNSVAIPSHSWNVPHSQLPYSQPIPSISNNNQPAFLNDSLLSRGSKDPLQTITPLPSNGNYNAASVMSIGGWNIVGASEINSYPGLMETGSAGLGLNRSFGNLTVNVGVGANRYRANMMDNPVLASQGIHSMSTQYGVGGALSLRLNNHWSVTAFGQYYNRNPYFFMAAFPYVKTSTYGAYATYRNGIFGMDLGTRRYYDAFGRKWTTEPIITPKFKLASKVWLELPVGGLVREGLENAIHHHHTGPTIMPPMR